MNTVEISAKHILSAKASNTKIFEQNRIENKDKLYKNFGSKTFYVEKRDVNEIGIFIPDLANTYKEITGRKDFLLLFDETDKEIYFVFADTPSILSPESCLKIVIKKDAFFEQSIKKLEEIVRFYTSGNRQIDVLCSEANKKTFVNIYPFSLPEIKKQINFIEKQEAKKIAINTPIVSTTSFSMRKTFVTMALILIPLGILHFGISSIENTKKISLAKAFDRVKEDKLKTEKEINTLEKDEFFVNKNYYYSLKEKEVLR